MLTATKQATTGYWIEALKKNVYSLEEINYFLYHHMDLVYRDFFSDALFDYIEQDLEQPAIAQDLREISLKNGGIGDFVRYLLSESYYYNSRELAQISALVAGIDNMGQAERMKVQGDSLYQSGFLNSALRCYLEILQRRDAEPVSDSFYARVAYSIGTIYARQFMCRSANTYFSLAYELSPDPAYARACLYMSLMTGDDEELLSSIVKYKISDDYLDAVRQRIKATRNETESSEETQIFFRNMEDEAFARDMLEQWKNEYYTILK